MSRLTHLNEDGEARITGLMTAKRTAELIPLCHPLTLERGVAIERIELLEKSGCANLSLTVST